MFEIRSRAASTYFDIRDYKTTAGRWTRRKQGYSPWRSNCPLFCVQLPQQSWEVSWRCQERLASPAPQHTMSHPHTFKRSGLILDLNTFSERTFNKLLPTSSARKEQYSILPNQAVCKRRGKSGSPLSDSVFASLHQLLKITSVIVRLQAREMNGTLAEHQRKISQPQKALFFAFEKSLLAHN